MGAFHEQRSEARRLRSRLALVRALVSILLAGFVTPSLAQDLPRYESRIEVRIFNVDVVVEDGDGRLLADLTRSDFELQVNGKPADIANFARIAEGRLESETSAELSVPIDSSRAPAPAPAEPVTWAVFVDQREFRPAIRNQALRDFARMLHTRMQPGDRGMVATFDGAILRVAVALTSEKRDVLRALAAAERTSGGGGPASMRARALRTDIQRAQPERPGPAQGLAYELATLIEEETARTLRCIHALAQVLDMVAGIQGRIAVIYVGPGINPVPALPLVDLWRSRFSKYEHESWAPKPESEQRATSRELERLMERASATRATVFSVYIGDRLQGLPSADDPEGNWFGPANDDSAHWTGMGHARSMAERTGGRLFMTNPGLTRRLEVIGDDLRTYYSLGFSVASAPGQRHAIDIRVKRPDTKVRYRDAVRHRTPQEESDQHVLGALFDESLRNNPLDVVATVGAPRRVWQQRSTLVPVKLEVPLRSLTLLPDGAKRRGGIRVDVGVAGDDGSVLRLESRVLPIDISSEDERALGQSVSYTFEVPVFRRRSRIAMVVRDEIGGTRSIVAATVGED